MNHRLTVAALAIAMVPAIVAASVWLVASPSWLRIEYGREGFPPAEGFTDEERMAVAVPSTLFLTRPSIRDEDLAQLTHDGRPLYEADEIRHLVDARNVAANVVRLGLGAGAVLGLAVAGATLRRRWRYSVSRGIEAGGWLTMVLSLWLALAALVAWPVAFVAFHETLFPPGTWQFSESSGLIRLFPEQFWFDSAVVLLAMVAIGGLLVAVGGRIARRALTP